MSYPQRGQITTTMQCYMYCYSAGIFYTATLIAVEGQPLRSLVFDPRAGATACFVNFSFINSFQRMIVRNVTAGTQSLIGNVGGVLDVSEVPSDIAPITTAANDDYFTTLGITSLASIPYNFFFNNNMIPFYSYIPDGSGGIVVDSSGVPVKQKLYGPFYIYSVTWFPLSNCSVTLSDQNTITGIVKSWLANGTMPSTRYFTDNADCLATIEYAYCPFREICTVGCNGPCINADQTCTYNNSDKAFYCSGGGSDGGTTENYAIAWFLLVIVFILILLVVLAMII